VVLYTFYKVNQAFAQRKLLKITSSHQSHLEKRNKNIKKTQSVNLLLTKKYYIVFPDTEESTFQAHMVNNMKVFIIAIFITLILSKPSFAQEVGGNSAVVPSEYSGYALFDAVNTNGEKLFVQSPVKYKLFLIPAPKDNDENYTYRNYKMEMERHQQEDAINHIDEETKKINSAAYYPLYFD